MAAINIILDERKQKEGISPDVLFVEIELDSGNSINIGERFELDELTKLRITVDEIFKHDVNDIVKIWVVWSNTDLTEGRGNSFPKYLCSKESTALRLRKGCGVQGTNGDITEENAYFIGNKLYAPAMILNSTKEDDREQERLDKKKIAIEKALKLGLTNEDIEDIIT